MANSIVQNLRGADRDLYGKLRAAFANDPAALSSMFSTPTLASGPTYVFDALTDDAVAFTVWDSNDPLNNSRADVGGFPSPALVFPANTLTPVESFTLVANDDTVGAIATRAMVLGSATAPTLVSAFQNVYTLRTTHDGSGNATRVAAGSTPGFTCTTAETGTGRTALAFPICASAQWIGTGVDWAANTIGTTVTDCQPTAINAAAGTGEARFFQNDTASLTRPSATHIITMSLALRETNGHVYRHTQDSADTADTLLKFGINTAPTPDSLILQVTGIATAELRWSGGVWIGERLPIAFRTQV